MFTGIIEAVGRITTKQWHQGDLQLQIDTGSLTMDDISPGDSIAVSGVCLTATRLTATGFRADVSAETLQRSVLGELPVGTTVNLEKALTPTTRMGGHLVSGHVDGVGEVLDIRQDARSWRLQIRAPAALNRYIAEKGSICVDGVSLTVNTVTAAGFGLNIVPYTWQQTTLIDYRVNRRVNLEVDLLARYLEQLLRAEKSAITGGLSEQLLRNQGFLS